ncbi:hypothetical protein [Roseovarius sp. MMSF_3350]|uniref:hypothetical protein n=1 Tax=Roseovarius sp. MMSF_3350 TaxID=3046706 RepID=UPI00273D2FFD|nr:hypothetical protein [Roseovarius sp. MMSF_3350]
MAHIDPIEIVGTFIRGELEFDLAAFDGNPRNQLSRLLKGVEQVQSFLLNLRRRRHYLTNEQLRLSLRGPLVPNAHLLHMQTILMFRI